MEVLVIRLLNNFNGLTMTDLPLMARIHDLLHVINMILKYLFVRMLTGMYQHPRYNLAAVHINKV